jgi:hypothetical protein
MLCECIHIGSILNISTKNDVLFIILQQNSDVIKVEDGGDVLGEDSVGMENNELYIRSTISIKEDEPEVSHDFR